jgi:tripartite-type tricarboxylate transporter receptor subunit TctC
MAARLRKRTTDGAPPPSQSRADGKLRPLAVTGSTRAEVLPDILTVGEFVRGYEASIWLGVGASKNTRRAPAEQPTLPHG